MGTSFVLNRCGTPKKKKKTVVVVSGSSCGKPLWKKGPAMEKK